MESKTMKTRISAVAVAVVMLLSLLPLTVLAADRININADGTAYISELTVNNEDKLSSLTQAADNTYSLGAYTPGTNFFFKVTGPSGSGQKWNYFNVQVREDTKEGTVVASANIGGDATNTPSSFDGIKGTEGDANGAPTFDVTFSINEDVLKTDKTYYLVLLSDSVVPQKTKIGQDIYFSFTTAGETEPEPEMGPYTWQKNISGQNWSIMFIKPATDSFQTAGLMTAEDGSQYYYNATSAVLCPYTEQIFSIAADGQGAAHFGKNNQSDPSEHAFIYSDKSLSADSLVASKALGNIVYDFQGGTDRGSDASLGGKSYVNLHVTANTLEAGKTYYFVTDEGMGNSGVRVMGVKTVTKFTTGHTEEAMDAIAPTCTEVGHEAGVACTQCKAYSEGGAEIAALGHTEEVLAAKEATCTETGLTEGKKCSECGEILVAQETIPALGHDYVNGVCTRCGEEKPKMTAELTSSAGNDLKARTQTTLKVENMQNGNPEDYTYKFIVYNTSTNQWYKLQDFGPETEFDWYTGPEGVKNLYVDIKSKTDETDVTRIALEGVNVTDSDLAVKSFTIAPEGVLPAQSQATLTVEAEKGTEPYEYKFIVYNSSTQQWYKLKDFGPESTFDWYTGPVGEKTLYVDVKDGTGKVVREQLSVTVQ